MCICACVSVCAYVFGAHMSILVPGAEKQRNKYGIFGSDSRKESSTRAKSLYLCNVPELNCGNLFVLAYLANVPRSCGHGHQHGWGRPGLQSGRTGVALYISFCFHFDFGNSGRGAYSQENQLSPPTFPGNHNDY